MAVRKIFESEESETQLETLFNINGFCYIRIGEANLHTDEWKGILLDVEDLSELIIELQFIKKQMENNE